MKLSRFYLLSAFLRFTLLMILVGALSFSCKHHKKEEHKGPYYNNIRASSELAEAAYPLVREFMLEPVIQEIFSPSSSSNSALKIFSKPVGHLKQILQRENCSFYFLDTRRDYVASFDGMCRATGYFGHDLSFRFHYSTTSSLEFMSAFEVSFDECRTFVKRYDPFHEAPFLDGHSIVYHDINRATHIETDYAFERVRDKADRNARCQISMKSHKKYSSEEILPVLQDIYAYIYPENESK